jgi:hypothetical protein
LRGYGDAPGSTRASRHFLAARELLSTPSLIPSEEVSNVLRRFASSLVVTAALVAACGGSDTSTPSAACNSFASAYCNKAQACGAPGAGGSCAPELQNAMGCAQLTCPAGTKFDSGAASDCIDAVNKLSCTDAANELGNGQLPGACNNICR